MAIPSSPSDPPSSSTSTTRPLFPNPPQPPLSTNPRHPTPLPLHFPNPPPSHPHLHHHPYQRPQTQPRSMYTAQSHSNIGPRVSPSNSIHPQLAPRPRPLHHDPPPQPPHGIMYPVASSGGSFLPKPIRSDQTVTVANPGGFPPRPMVTGNPHHPFRPFGFTHLDPAQTPVQGPTMHLVRPTHLQHTLLGSNGGVTPVMVKGVPVSTHPKVAPSSTSVSDCNGYKDLRDRNRDDAFTTIRDRKVRISDSASLYALCRSWLRNGFPEESEPQYMDDVKSLPRPLPIPVVDDHSAVKKEGDKGEEEEEGSVEQLSPQELLQRHIMRAKRVRSRLREERLQRIARYKTRLALLLPPIVEHQFRNDTSTGN